MESTKEQWNWNGYRAYEKWFIVIGLVCYVPVFAALIMGVLEAFEVLQPAFNPFLLVYILVAVGNGLSTIGYWRRNRNIAIVFLAIAIICVIRLLISL